MNKKIQIPNVRHLKNKITGGGAGGKQPQK